MIELAPLWQFVALLAVHWVADFVLQTNWQARNKSKSNVALSRHVLVYTGCIGAATALLAQSGSGGSTGCGLTGVASGSFSG
jgi:hypothetical protein